MRQSEQEANGVAAASRVHWLLLGAGNMGTLAARYLIRAGHCVGVVGTGPTVRHKTLAFADSRPSETLRLPVRKHPYTPIRHLIVACKTPYTASRLAGLPLADDIHVIRLQNGLGSLDGCLPARAHLIEAVTTSAVRGRHPEHEVVAENATFMGGPAAPPPWFKALTEHWPGLVWSADIRRQQWRKLVANAVINPLTGLHDVANGQIARDPVLCAQGRKLAAEADGLLARLDPAWPGNSWPGIVKIAAATAANTSSMRADMQRGAATEIAAINGWLLEQAARLGVALPAHRAVVDAVLARHPA